MPVVVLVIDQLSASMLGPYGNTTLETPNFNRLAAESLLFDFAFADSMDLEEAYRAMWSGARSLPAAEEGVSGRSSPSNPGMPCEGLVQDPVKENSRENLRGHARDDSKGLAGRLADTGIDSILITDDPAVGQHPQADFDRVIEIAQPDCDRLATRSSETQLANFFAQATAWLSSDLESDQICWLHSRGLSGAWDAPYDMRTQGVDEDDPPPPTTTESPSMWSDPGELDPDEVLGWQQSAAAQVSLIDEFLGVLLDELEASSLASSTLFVLASPRGCALGEHGLVGVGEQLYNESIQVPLLVRFPEGPMEAPVESPKEDRETEANLEIEKIEGAEGTDAVQGTRALRPDRVVGRSGRLVHVRCLSALIEGWLMGDDHSHGDQSGDRQSSVAEVLAAIDAVLPQRNWERILTVSKEQEAFQTHAWKLIRSKVVDEEGGGIQLFAKPDDRWEVNDVSDRCPGIVEQMVLALEETLAGRACLLPDELVFREN